MKQQQTLAMRHMRWPQDQWEFLGEVAKAAGLTRSEFVRDAAMAQAARMAAGLPYSVSGTPQNTGANQFLTSNAKQGRVGSGGRRSEPATKRSVEAGQFPEEIGRDGLTNEADQQAIRPLAPRS